MEKHGFVVLTRERDWPIMAKCGKCQIKFFTPTRLRGRSAEEYLWQKFLEHECKENGRFPPIVERQLGNFG